MMRLAGVLVMGVCVLVCEASFTADSPPTAVVPAEWALVVAEDATPAETHAAQEFQALFEKATSVQLAIGPTVPEGKKPIFIGPGDAMRACPLGYDASKLGDEELRIRIRPEAIVVAGGRPRGTVYAVYEFMERYLGVRFLTHDHTHVPAAEPPIEFPSGDYAYAPPFSFRWSYYHENNTNPPFAARLRVNTVTHDEKLGGVAPQRLINHSFHRYLKPEDYFAEHPEYFALVNGERRADIGGGGPEPCVTNPDVIKIITEGILADVRANPSIKNISCSQNDNDAYCRCDACEAINQREGTPMGANLHLVNAVADAVAREFPDVKVGTLSYWYTRKPPKHMKPRDNVQIQLCSIECCCTYPLDHPDIAKNRDFCSDIETWGKMCDDIWIWHYNTDFAAYDLPFPNLRTIAPNLRFFRANNVKGVFMQANGNGSAGEFSDLRNYVISRCLWNPGRDGWAEVEEFCTLHYGQAAPVMLEYLTYIHDVAQNSGYAPGCFATAEELGLNAGVARRSLALFARAMKAAESDAVRDRVEKASICAYRCFIETGTSFRYADGKVQLVFPAGYEDVPDTYVALCRKHDMTRAAERITFDEYLGMLSRLREGSPAARIENDTWRLTFLPERNGRLIEFRHKPTGRDLLATWPRAGVRECGGIFEEAPEKGYKDGAFDARVDGDAVVLTRALPGGGRMIRRVTLDGGMARFETQIDHAGDAAAVYQVKVRPEWDCVTNSGDHRVVSAYVNDGTEWRLVNQGWETDHGPNEAQVESAQGGFAFYNHEDGFGVGQTYDPAQIERPRLWHNTGRHQINLELITRNLELKPGESTAFWYEVRYLERAPRRAHE